MKPLIWTNTQDVKSDGYALFDNTMRKTNSYIFMSGQPLPNKDIGNLEYSHDPKNYDLIYTYRYSELHLRRFDCLPNTGQAPLVNQKILDILNKLCPNDIQAFPVTIVPESPSKHTFVNHDYWLINITKLVEAIDLERSDVEFFDHDPRIEDAIRTIKKLAFIDSDKFAKPLIGRINNKRSMEIVSSSLAEAFKEAKVTGVEFREDKDY